MVKLEETIRDLKMKNIQLIAQKKSMSPINESVDLQPDDYLRSSSVGDDNTKMKELKKETKLLQKRTNKDEKLLKMQKKMFDKHV